MYSACIVFLSRAKTAKNEKVIETTALIMYKRRAARYCGNPVSDNEALASSPAGCRMAQHFNFFEAESSTLVSHKLCE